MEQHNLTRRHFFNSGTLDSFALVDFVTVLEEHCGIRIPDAEVIPANFRTIKTLIDTCPNDDSNYESLYQRYRCLPAEQCSQQRTAG